MHHNAILLIIDSNKAPDQARTEACAVLEHWPVDDRPTLEVCYAHQLISAPPASASGMVWIMFDSLEDAQLFEVIGWVEEHHLPAMLSCDQDQQPAGTSSHLGIVNCSPSTPAQATCAMLQTLWSQAATVEELKTELHMLQVHRGGLADQMNLIDEELRLAAQLQREFLPTELPQLNGVHFEVMWRPAGYVSGDIYDVTRLDEHHLGFFIADAVGHGVPAALMTMYIKRSLKTKQTDPSMPGGYRLIEPGEALAKLNHDMVERQAGKIRFATACYGILDTRNLTMRLARAGHPFPMILRAEGHTEMIDPEGSLLGVFPNEEFNTQIVQLNRGDRLLIYSDGFEVAFPGTGERDKLANEQYLQEFEALRQNTLSKALAAFEQRVDEQAGSLNQRDDLTVLCMGIDAIAASSAADAA